MNRIRRAVFDTSTMVSAALRVGSVPIHALLHAFACSDLCESAATLAELEMVLKRKKFDRYLDSKSRGAFLALAQVAEADAIVTSDEDLLVLHPWHQIPILRPADFLASSARTWKKRNEHR